MSDLGDHLLEAVRLAEVNAQAGGLPFGAVVVRDAVELRGRHRADEPAEH